MTAYTAILVDAKNSGADPDYTHHFAAPNGEVAKTEACKWAESYRGMISQTLMLIVKPRDGTVPILSKEIDFR